MQVPFKFSPSLIGATHFFCRYDLSHLAAHASSQIRLLSSLSSMCGFACSAAAASAAAGAAVDSPACYNRILVSTLTRCKWRPTPAIPIFAGFGPEQNHARDENLALPKKPTRRKPDRRQWKSINDYFSCSQVSPHWAHSHFHLLFSPTDAAAPAFNRDRANDLLHLNPASRDPQAPPCSSIEAAATQNGPETRTDPQRRRIRFGPEDPPIEGSLLKAPRIPIFSY